MTTITGPGGHIAKVETTRKHKLSNDLRFPLHLFLLTIIKILSDLLCSLLYLQIKIHCVCLYYIIIIYHNTTLTNYNKVKSGISLFLFIHFNFHIKSSNLYTGD